MFVLLGWFSKMKLCFQSVLSVNSSVGSASGSASGSGGADNQLPTTSTAFVMTLLEPSLFHSSSSPLTRPNQNDTDTHSLWQTPTAMGAVPRPLLLHGCLHWKANHCFHIVQNKIPYCNHYNNILLIITNKLWLLLFLAPIDIFIIIFFVFLKGGQCFFINLITFIRLN